MLFQLYEKFRIKKKNKAYNVRDIDSFLSDEVEQFETQAPDGMNIIKNYIKERRPKISQEDSLTLRETLLFGKIAHVSYSENRSLEINPIYFDHMLEVLK
jgi:hypothetical protein